MPQWKAITLMLPCYLSTWGRWLQIPRQTMSVILIVLNTTSPTKHDYTKRGIVANDQKRGYDIIRLVTMICFMWHEFTEYVIAHVLWYMGSTFISIHSAPTNTCTNKLKPIPNDRYFADDIFKWIFMYGNSLNFYSNVTAIWFGPIRRQDDFRITRGKVFYVYRRLSAAVHSVSVESESMLMRCNMLHTKLSKLMMKKNIMLNHIKWAWLESQCTILALLLNATIYCCLSIIMGRQGCGLIYVNIDASRLIVYHTILGFVVFGNHRVMQYIKPRLLDIRGITPNTKTTASELYSNSFRRITGKIKYSPAIIISGYGRSTTGIFRALHSYLRSTRDRAFLYICKVSHKSFNKICNQQAWRHLKDIHMKQFVKRYVVSKVARNHICFVENSNDRGE